MGVDENMCGTAAFPAMLPRKPSARLSGLWALRLALLPGVERVRDSQLPDSAAVAACSVAGFALKPCAKAKVRRQDITRNTAWQDGDNVQDLVKALFWDLDLGSLGALL